MRKDGEETISYIDGCSECTHYQYFPKAYYVQQRYIAVGMESEAYQLHCEGKLDEGCVLYYLLLHENPGDRRIVLTMDGGDEIREDESGECRCVSYRNVEALAPKNKRDRIYKLLHGLSLCYPELGATFAVGKQLEDTYRRFPNDEKYLVFSRNTEEESISNTIDFLIDAGYLTRTKRYLSTDGSHVMLSPEAWQIITEREVPCQGQIFIAMPYAKKLKFHEQLIKDAVHEAGYSDMIIKDKDHTNYIPEEIEKEIQNSVGVIADLTDSNVGVYYEAGYARGCGKTVIFVCEDAKESSKQDGEKIHFDIRQINTLFWKKENAKEFQEQLTRRIRHTIP